MGIILNILIPFLGLFATSKVARTRLISLFLASIISLFSALSYDNDILLSYVYIKYSSLVLAIIAGLLTIASIYIIYKDRKNLKYNYFSICAIFTFFVLSSFFAPRYLGESNILLANSLSPYLNADSVLIYSNSKGKIDKGFTVVKHSNEKKYSVGYVLAVEGDKIGVSDNIPVICKQIGADERCFDVRNVCEFLRGNARIIDSKLSKVAELGANEIALTTYLDIPNFDLLKYTVKNYQTTYNLRKVFDMNKLFSFGIDAPNEYCKTPNKNMYDLLL